MSDLDLLNRLKTDYKHLHPLFIYRCMERSKTEAELTQALESQHDVLLPMRWDANNRCWKHCSLVPDGDRL